MSPSAIDEEEMHSLQLPKHQISQKALASSDVRIDHASMVTSTNLSQTGPRRQSTVLCDAQDIPHLSISEDYHVSEQPLGTIRPVRIICIGAGASGVNLAYQVQKYLQKADLVLYEKSPAIGGTWYENRYPGCKCDIRKCFRIKIMRIRKTNILIWCSFP